MSVAEGAEERPKRIRRKKRKVKIKPIPLNMWPTIRQEAIIRAIHASVNGYVNHDDLAERMEMPVNTIRAIIAHHKTLRKNGDVGGPVWYGEKRVPCGQVVRCPKCRNRLAVWIPRHAVLGCRVCRTKAEKGL